MFTNTVKGETTIYGTVDTVKTNAEPTISFTTIEGTELSITAERNVVLAVASRIGQQIGLYGVEEIDSQTFERKSFHATEVSSYEKTSIVKTFRDISAKYGKYFDGIEGSELREQI